NNSSPFNRFFPGYGNIPPSGSIASIPYPQIEEFSQCRNQALLSSILTVLKPPISYI
ncbi:Hypothetical predicted protein, partial [Marmota monax]